AWSGLAWSGLAWPDWPRPAVHEAALTREPPAGDLLRPASAGLAAALDQLGHLEARHAVAVHARPAVVGERVQAHLVVGHLEAAVRAELGRAQALGALRHGLAARHDQPRPDAQAGARAGPVREHVQGPALGGGHDLAEMVACHHLDHDGRF